MNLRSWHPVCNFWHIRQNLCNHLAINYIRLCSQRTPEDSNHQPFGQQAWNCIIQLSFLVFLVKGKGLSGTYTWYQVSQKLAQFKQFLNVARASLGTAAIFSPLFQNQISWILTYQKFFQNHKIKIVIWSFNTELCL